MLDSGLGLGSKLKAPGVFLNSQPKSVVLVACGDLVTTPSCVYDLCVEIYVLKFIVPSFLVPGQRD